MSPSDLLLVAIAPDSYLRTVKGRAPYWSQVGRMQTVASLSGVDGVIAQKETSVATLIYLLKPTWFVKGADWRDRLPADVVRACRDVGAEIVWTETEAKHTSEAIA